LFYISGDGQSPQEQLHIHVSAQLQEISKKRMVCWCQQEGILLQQPLLGQYVIDDKIL
jgi:hypothetical protein